MQNTGKKFSNKIHDSLNWGDTFFLFEKVRVPDARFKDITTQMYNKKDKYNNFVNKCFHKIETTRLRILWC